MHSTFIFVTNCPRCEDWNIMGNQKMANVATLVPTTLDELADCELPQNVQKQYGERLIKNINAYIEQEHLQKYVENRPKKKLKAAVEMSNLESKPILIDVPDSDNDDEFEDGIDYAAIEIPVPAQLVEKQPNPYNQKKTAHMAESMSKPKKSSYFWDPITY